MAPESANKSLSPCYAPESETMMEDVVRFRYPRGRVVGFKFKIGILFD